MLKLTEVTAAEARKSSLIVAGVLFLIAAWNLYRGRPTVFLVILSVAGALVLMGLFVPALARRFHVMWMGLARILGYINSHILLSLVFFLIFAPYNLIGRLIRRDALNRRRPKNSSYWIPRKTTRQSPEQFERLF
jgi:hypothetical protein